MYREILTLKSRGDKDNKNSNKTYHTMNDKKYQVNGYKPLIQVESSYTGNLQSLLPVVKFFGNIKQDKSCEIFERVIIEKKNHLPSNYYDFESRSLCGVPRKLSRGIGCADKGIGCADKHPNSELINLSLSTMIQRNCFLLALLNVANQIISRQFMFLEVVS